MSSVVETSLLSLCENYEQMQGILYLFPVTLGDTPIDKVLPPHNGAIISTIRHFIVENERTARRFLRKSDPVFDIDGSTFYILNKHTSPEEITSYLKPAKEGCPVGLLSEAGCPAIADPGSDIVRIAQQAGITVTPLVGPSSIVLSLMASGFNGQSFAFNGYLPIDAAERVKTLKRLEQRIYNEHQTQIFIETPYRNHKLIDELSKNCQPSTKLCVAANLTCDDEWVKTLPVKQWAKEKVELSKTPAIFLLYK